MTLLYISHNEEKLVEGLLEAINTTLGTSFSDSPFAIQDPDIHILFEPEATSIGIASTKLFAKKLRNRPFKRSLQIGFIPRFDMLTPESQNALLKELEDHRSSTMYILGAINEHNILQTIKSRSQITYIKAGHSSKTEVEISELSKLFANPAKNYLNAFKITSNIEWNKAKALSFLSNLYAELPITISSQRKLELLTHASTMIHNNVPPKQVFGYVLLKLLS